MEQTQCEANCLRLFVERCNILKLFAFACPQTFATMQFILHQRQQLTFLDTPLVQKSCLLLVYYHLLLTLKLANPRQPRRSLTALSNRLADGVQSHLLNTFGQSTPADTADGQPSYAIDSVGKQRILCHLLVCTLLMCGGKVSGGELELVSEECKMGVIEVVAAVDTLRTTDCSVLAVKSR